MKITIFKYLLIESILKCNKNWYSGITYLGQVSHSFVMLKSQPNNIILLHLIFVNIQIKHEIHVKLFPLLNHG